MKLWYEYEYRWTPDFRKTDGRSHLPSGKYNCRFLITEESFHEQAMATGGMWATVLGTEGYTEVQDSVTKVWKVTDHDRDPSNDIAFSIGLPAAPSSLTATGGNGQVTLSWSAATGATSYNVKRATAAGGPYSTIGNATSTSYIDATATYPNTYFYVVSAVNTVGESFSKTNEASARPRIPAPTGLTASATTDTVNLSWSGVTGATDYYLRRGTASGVYDSASILVPRDTSNAPRTTYADTNVVPGTKYYYVVYAADAIGQSDNSNEANATPATTPPTAPSALSATAVSATTINLTWTAGSGDQTGFKIWRSQNGGNVSQIASVGLTSYSDTTCVAATQYSYYVTAHNDGGDSAPSETKTATTLAAAPTGLTIAVTTVGTASVTLTWNVSAGATSYNVKRTTNGTTTTVSVPRPVSGTTASYTHTVPIGAIYYYVVTASSNGVENTTPSNRVSAAFLKPSHDAHVRSGSGNSTTNYGTASILEVKTSTSTKENRDAYLKFSLQGVSSVTNAQLWIFAGLSTSGTISTSLHKTSNTLAGTATLWTETGTSGLKWTNKPALLTPVLSSVAGDYDDFQMVFVRCHVKLCSQQHRGWCSESGAPQCS